MFLILAAAAIGCTQTPDTIDRRQPNLLEKSIFEGEWWYTQTIVNVDGDAADVVGVFNGSMAWADLGVDKAQSGTMARILWVIDESYLFAYRGYELIDGGNDDGRDPDFRGQPLAVFRILSHADVRQAYNSLTGEPTSVIEENSTDRKWYERRYMRVDWSQNLITSFYDVNDVYIMFYGYRRESAPFFVQDGSHPELPESWQPQFVRIADNPDYRFADEWAGESPDTIHYMSFVTKELFSPGEDCLYRGTACQTVSVAKRNAFLRVPPNHDYAAAEQGHPEFDRFGLFRTYQRTYIRGGRDHSALHKHCTANTVDRDCGAGGTCDETSHMCVGGLTNSYGETDFLTFYRPRHNIWSNSLDRDKPCAADWECNGQYADTPGSEGSVCDRAAGYCQRPLAERTIRPVTYHLNAGFPAHLVPSAFQIVGSWNEVYMRGQRIVTGRDLPEGPDVTCQSTDPTQYCYCGSPEDSGGACHWKYDPFKTPAEQIALGVADPYNCYVARPAGWTEPEHPTSYDDYPKAEVYGHTFTFDASLGDGESECVLLLASNSCDVDPTRQCEELGDIRYQFFNYIQHGNVYFGGVSLPLVDPTTGEFISSNANMAGESIESFATMAMDFFPVLRNEPGAEARYFTGENIRGYYDRLGRVEHPVALAPNGGSGLGTSDNSRPAAPLLGSLDYAREATEAVAQTAALLEGTEGRARILSDRIHALAGTPLEQRLVQSLGVEGREAMQYHYDLTRTDPSTEITDPDVLERVSPFRDGYLASLRREDERWEKLGRYNIDPPFNEARQRSRNYEYFAEAFDGADPAEASIRMQQLLLRNVMFHEMGHSVGLRHNFAGSLDRDQYADGYFAIADELPLPRMRDFDTNRENGVTGDEINAYTAELRRVRDERTARGAGLVMSSSVMDYSGDLSDTQGIGRYDVAATIWNQFDKAEVFESDPYETRNDSLNGVARSDRTARRWVTYYEGGEACQVDADCPFDRAAATAAGQPTWQRCLKFVRSTAAGSPPCRGDSNCLCSSFDRDMTDFADPAAATPFKAGADSQADYRLVNYLFCGDERTDDISWCSRYDAGESFEEVIDHARRTWEEAYPRAYYRRFRLNGGRGGGSRLYIEMAVKIFQHFLFRFIYEEPFRHDVTTLGIIDHQNAGLDAMHWLMEIVNLPDTGSYALDADANVYRRLGEALGMDEADISLDVGQGYPVWSKYQDGYWGFYRTERAGVFFDKLMALEGLARRDWKLGYTVDQRFYYNFYSFYPTELSEFFGGLILNDPRWFAPRIVEDGDGNPVVQNMSFYRSYVREPPVPGEYLPARTESQDETYPAPALEGTSNDVVRLFATLWALSEFPVTFDTGFEQRLAIFRYESGSGFAIPATQPDGSTTCAYGSVKLEDAHETDCDDHEADYIVFNSARTHTPYVAVKAREYASQALDPYNVAETQVGFEFLRRLTDRAARIDVLDAITSPNAAQLSELRRLRTEQQQDESFLETLIEIEQAFGISTSI